MTIPHTSSSSPRRSLVRAAAISLAIGIAALSVTASSAGRKFYSDDPLTREPETQDASGAAEVDINLLYDLSYNLFVTARRPVVDVRAQNINTIDEVPDSSWFTNRIGTRTLSLDEVVRGPNSDAAPAPGQWTIIRPKTSGFAPGFTARDSKGQIWFVSFDPPSNPEGATGAIAVATKIFWALGYNQVENFVASIASADDIVIEEGVTMRRPNGKRTPMTRGDLGEILERAARNADGSYRIAAGRALEGKVIGGFLYKDTRPDDPNDLVPHQHRRELRALRVFGAWTNLTDMKAGNTLDTIVKEDGKGIVKHYLQDVGSTFGMGANGPHDWDEGWEYVYEGGPTLKRLLTFGFALSPWQTAHYEKYTAVGRFEGDSFRPETWRPRVPPAAYLQMRDDDAFWAARRVMAFSDDMIRAMVKTGQYTDERAMQYLGDVLIKRRDKIGNAYLTKVNPIVDLALDDAGNLTFGNAAVKHGLAAAPESYRGVWSTFDNTTRASARIAETTSRGESMPAPSGLARTNGSYVRVSLSAVSSEQRAWAQPVEAYFRREAGGWKLVGFERMPAEAEPAAKPETK
jgi:hypothetical protein